MGKTGERCKDALGRVGRCIPGVCLALAAPLAHGQAAAAPFTGKSLQSLTHEYCSKCHNTTDWAGGFAFDTLDPSQPGHDPQTWEMAVTKLTGRLMPPAGQKQPSQPAVDAAINYLQTSLDDSANDRGVGHVPLERLSRDEFAASVKGLLGVTVDPKEVLPTEIEVDGFSNIARALTVSPTFMQQYLVAARHIAETAVGQPLPKVADFFSGGGGGGGGQAGPGSPVEYEHRDGYPLGTRGGVRFTHVFPADGLYRFSFHEGDSLDAGLYPSGMESRSDAPHPG